jgi:hypothetical protein
MPSIRIQDGNGRIHQCDSSDTDLLARWLVETIERVKPDHIYPCQMIVYPLWQRDETGREVSDWPPKAEYINNVFSLEDLIQKMAVMLSAPPVTDAPGH